MQHIKVQVNKTGPPQSYSDHFLGATNKGTHSLSVYDKMTTKAIQSFLLRNANGIDKSLIVSF